MKYKQQVQVSLEKIEQLALTLETVVNNPRLAEVNEIKRLATAIRHHIKQVSDKVSLEYEG
tara:strand:- start:394 stop:576 length:183 start_codon:yes stop_codon:yes gene_type:complete